MIYNDGSHFAKEQGQSREGWPGRFEALFEWIHTDPAENEIPPWVVITPDGSLELSWSAEEAVYLVILRESALSIVVDLRALDDIIDDRLANPPAPEPSRWSLAADSLR
jgi:hypothetical protein